MIEIRETTQKEKAKHNNMAYVIDLGHTKQWFTEKALVELLDKLHKVVKNNAVLQHVVGSALHPKKINHGDVWGHGKDWFTFYCPNENCKRQVSGETECPHCGHKIVWGNS